MAQIDNVSVYLSREELQLTLYAIEYMMTISKEVGNDDTATASDKRNAILTFNQYIPIANKLKSRAHTAGFLLSEDIAPDLE